MVERTPAGSVDSVAAGVIEAGRITGMIAGYLLLVQILLMSRVGWLDRRLCANDLLRLHRDLGCYLLVVIVLAHAALIIVGYAGSGRFVAVHRDPARSSRTYEDMISAFVATGVLVGVGAAGDPGDPGRSCPTSCGTILHLTSYLVLLLGYGHQFADGRDLSEPGPGRTVLGRRSTSFVLACLIWGRVIAPLRLNLRHRLRVAEVVPEGPDMFSVYVRGRRLDELQARAGQFFRWRFLTRGTLDAGAPVLALGRARTGAGCG